MHFYKLPTCPPNQVEPTAVQPVVYENMYCFPTISLALNVTNHLILYSLSKESFIHSFHAIQQTHIVSENVNNLFSLLCFNSLSAERLCSLANALSMTLSVVFSIILIVLLCISQVLMPFFHLRLGGLYVILVHLTKPSG